MRPRSRRTSPTRFREEYLLGDKALYLKAVKNSHESYSRTGIIPQSAGEQSVLDTLRLLDPELRDAKIDLAATFTDRFVKQATI